MKTAEQIFLNKLVHYNPTQFPKGMKKAFIKAMEEYAEQFKKTKNGTTDNCNILVVSNAVCCEKCKYSKNVGSPCTLCLCGNKFEATTDC